MDRPQPDETPLHPGILSDATTSEEVLLPRDRAPEGDAPLADGGDAPSASIGTGGETDPDAPLPNAGGVG